MDLRLLGVGLRDQPIADLAQRRAAVAARQLVVMIVTGTPLFLSESIKCYYSQAFWVKITTLPLALLFTLTIRSGSRRRERGRDTAATRLVAVVVADAVVHRCRSRPLDRFLVAGSPSELSSGFKAARCACRTDRRWAPLATELGSGTEPLEY